jgi:hypothetical protein
MKMVSSPEIVPTTSGHCAVSIASATLCAEPMRVFSTIRLPPALKIAVTNCRTAGNAGGRRQRCLRQNVAIAHLRNAEFTQIAAHARLRCGMPLLAQQLDELGLAAHTALADDPGEQNAARRRAVVIGIRVHKIARMLHKNANIVKTRDPCTLGTL